MTGIYDVPSSKLIAALAQKLKNVENITPPVWAAYSKTGVHKERPPYQREWWYTRTAAVLLKVDKLGIVGVEKIRTQYGGKKNRGYKPEHFRKGSGSIARKILQQLDTAGFTKKAQKGVHKGRMLTAKGKGFLKEAAAGIGAQMDAKK